MNPVRLHVQTTGIRANDRESRRKRAGSTRGTWYAHQQGNVNVFIPLEGVYARMKVEIMRHFGHPFQLCREAPPDRERYGRMQNARPGAADKSRRFSQVQRRCQVEGDASDQEQLAHKGLPHSHHPGLVVGVWVEYESRRGGSRQAGSFHAGMVRVNH